MNAGAGDFVTRLKKLDCCAVSDALDKLHLKGAVTGLTELASSRRIAGRVLTVKLGVGEPPGGKPRHVSTTAIESAQPGDIIVVEQHSGVNAASWGGILTLGAKLRGVAGWARALIWPNAMSANASVRSCSSQGTSINCLRSR